MLLFVGVFIFIFGTAVGLGGPCNSELFVVVVVVGKSLQHRRNCWSLGSGVPTAMQATRSPHKPKSVGRRYHQ